MLVYAARHLHAAVVQNLKLLDCVYCINCERWNCEITKFTAAKYTGFAVTTESLGVHWMDGWMV